MKGKKDLADQHTEKKLHTNVNVASWELTVAKHSHNFTNRFSSLNTACQLMKASQNTSPQPILPPKVDYLYSSTVWGFKK